MISEKNKANEEGYLLLESLFTMMILITIITLLSPLIIDWIKIHQNAKKLVEENRFLYESSMDLENNQSNKKETGSYSIERSKKSIRIKETGTEVSIYEITFE